MKMIENWFNKNATFFKQIRTDLIVGIVYSWKMYIPAFFIYIFVCLHFNNMLSSNISLGLIQSKPSFADYIIEIFKGMERYDLTNRQSSFEVPVIWLLINIYLVYLVSSYPFNDLYGYGQQVLLLSKKRKQWWISKCIWNISTVLVFYFVGYVVISIFSIFNGDISMQLHSDINFEVSKVNTSGFKRNDFIIVAVVLPIITSIAISLFEMIVTLVCKPIISCILMICLLVVSAYSCSTFLLGNYLMILRSNSVIPSEGVEAQYGIGIAVFLSIFSIVIGYKIFRRLDIFEKE
jgi:hypothetical protein